MKNLKHCAIPHPIPIILVLLFIWSIAIFACAYDPNNDPNYVASQVIFDDKSLPTIQITIDPADLAEILRPGNEQSNTYYPAILHFTNHLIDDTITTVGLRLRGNTSRYSAKKSFKVSFSKFVSGRRFYGLKKFNLNGEHNDPSIIRSKLCWNLFNEFGVPASRANHIRLYINDEYRGLYINVEHIDSTFIQSRFGNPPGAEGNLFKCLYQGAPADLTYRADGRYDLIGGGTTYELKTNEDNPDYADLAHFVDVLNNTQDDDFTSAIERVFNVEGFLKWMTVSTNCGSWDDYLWLANNYYLYHNQETDKFEFIPYDYDNTLGISWGPRDWATRNVYEFRNHSEPRPLGERILAHQVYVDKYSYFLDSFLTNHFSLELIEPEIDRLKAMIQTAAEEDLYRTYDYSWTINDFNRSYTEAVGAHVVYGLKPFFTTRRNATLDQLLPYSTPTPTPTPTPTLTPTPTPDCPTTPTLVINEFCADNDHVTTDSFGEYDDWIEIYNYGTEEVSLGGMYLTDDPDDPAKFRIPDGLALAAKSFALFWADGDLDQGDYHCSFKLSKKGEAVGLYDTDECANRCIDLIIFGPQETDVSYGRVYDTALEWCFFDKPTPGASNGSPPFPSFLMLY